VEGLIGKSRARSKNTVKADAVNYGSVVVRRQGFLFCFFSLLLFEKRKELRALGAKRGPKAYRLFLPIIFCTQKQTVACFFVHFFGIKKVKANPYLKLL